MLEVMNGVRNMAVKFTSVKCPDCGAVLPIEEGRNQVFCSYCGSKIIMTNENEYVYRHIDEAEIKQAETERILKLKKMEMIEKKNEEAAKIKRIKIKLTIVLGILSVIFIGMGYVGINYGLIMPGLICCIIMAYMWLLGDNQDDDSGFGDKIKVPKAVFDYEDKNYVTMEALFESAGFTNVKSIPLNDLAVGLLKKPGVVESIMINGQPVSYVRRRFLPNAAVVISYHSYR